MERELRLGAVGAVREGVEEGERRMGIEYM